MKKETKNVIIDNLSETIKNNPNFYVVDVSGLNAGATTDLRRKCFESKVMLQVVKNTMLQKALERNGFPEVELYSALVGPTALMTASEGAAVPAKLIQEFRKTNDKPVLKGAYVQESLYMGDESLTALANIKSREELIGDVLSLLQSPAKNVVSALKSAGGTIAGLLKTMEERAA